MIHEFWAVFAELIRAPFQQIEMIWGIVPLYFGLLLNELTSPKASFRTAIQTGFSFIWAGVQWLYPYFKARGGNGLPLDFFSMTSVKLFVTFLVLSFGVAALFCGIGKRFPRYGRFLGHTRFANYFMITIFPMQTGHLGWSWNRVLAIAVFAIPVWLVLRFGLIPFRGRK